MANSVDALSKSVDKLILAWTPEKGVVGTQSYNLYVGLVDISTSLVSLATGISSVMSQKPGEVGKIAYVAEIADVRAALSLADTVTFANTQFFFAVTFVLDGVESTLADSPISGIPPVGIITKYRKYDPGANRHMYGFSEDAWRWVKLMSSSGGALITDSNAFYALNTVTEYTYDGTNVSSMKTFLSDQTAAGSPAKLTTYEYSGSQVSKVTVTDSTV